MAALSYYCKCLSKSRKCKHSFSNCLKINEWQRKTKSESKSTLCLIVSQCLKQNREKAYFEFTFLFLKSEVRRSHSIIKFIHAPFSPPSLWLSLDSFLVLERQTMWDSTAFVFRQKHLLPFVSLSWQQRSSFMSQVWFCNRKRHRVRKESISEGWRATRKESKGTTVNVCIILLQNILPYVLCSFGFMKWEKKKAFMNSKNHIFATKLYFYFSTFAGSK